MPRTSQFDPELDPYEILEIAPDATLKDIRQAYKKQVLRAHPDKNPKRKSWSERRIRELLRAFEILGDSDRRRLWDQESAIRKKVRKPTEKDLFFFKKNDPECVALRILYLLLHDRGKEALTLLGKSESHLGIGFLQEQLDRQDYLDCLFLLGEYLIQKKSYREALGKLLTLYRYEQPSRFRRHYFSLVEESLKALYLRHLPRTLSPRDVIAHLENGLDEVSWTVKETARLYLSLAKAHLQIDESEKSQRWIERSLQADPGFQKARRWRAEVLSGAS